MELLFITSTRPISRLNLTGVPQFARGSSDPRLQHPLFGGLEKRTCGTGNI